VTALCSSGQGSYGIGVTLLRPRLLAALASATILALLLAGALGAERAAAQRLQITSFSDDRVLSRSGPTSLEPFCRRGFQLLSARFSVINVNPRPTLNPATQPAVAVVGVVPKPKSVEVMLQNLRAPGVIPTVRGTVDCMKARGRVARRAAGAGEGPATIARKRRRRVRVSPYVATAKKRVGAARAARTTFLRETCGKRNSIPSDLGFESRGATFAGATVFKRKGKIGVKAGFNTDGRDRLKLHVLCQKGKALKLKGAVSGRRAAGSDAAAAASGAGAAARRARSPLIKVAFQALQGTLRRDYPYPGSGSFGVGGNDYWLNPVPSSVPEGYSWMGRLVRPTFDFPLGLSSPLPSGGGGGDVVDEAEEACRGERGEDFDDCVDEYLRCVDLEKELGPDSGRVRRCWSAWDRAYAGGMTMIAPPPFPSTPPSTVEPFDISGLEDVVIGTIVRTRTIRVRDKRTADELDPVIPGGGTTAAACADGVDNDGDSVADDQDPGCLTGPGRTYDEEDTGEADIFDPPATCPASGSETHIRRHIYKDNHVLVRHVLDIGGSPIVDRGQGDGDFADGSLPPFQVFCTDGTVAIASVEWTTSPGGGGSPPPILEYEVTLTYVSGTGGTVPMASAPNTRAAG
jgi:hypothetical protein